MDFSGKQWIKVPVNDFSALELDAEHAMPELYRLNNHIRRLQVFSKLLLLCKARFYFTVENPGKATIMYFPVINWTNENGWMAGIAFHNGFLIPETISNTSLCLFILSKTTLQAMERSLTMYFLTTVSSG